MRHGLARAPLMLKTIWQTIVFYGACIKWAAHGTLELANAWFWLVGLPAVAIIGAYLGFGELRVPDNPPEFIAFMLVTVFATWIVFFAIRLLLAPAHLYEEAKQVYEEAKKATAIAQTAN